MEVTEEVERLAKMARIHIPKENLEKMALEFDSVVAYIRQLDELTLTKEGGPKLPKLHNVFRSSERVNPPGTWTKSLTNLFPKKDGDSLSVKKILSHD